MWRAHRGIGKTTVGGGCRERNRSELIFAQLHRDTRLLELIGDAVIRGEKTQDDGEVIDPDVRAGALLTCEVAVLDDISRAPGEALNVLLRLLNERKYHERPIPLERRCNRQPDVQVLQRAPLDPATLDRFALQVRTEGLVGGGEWHDAATVMDKFGDSPYCTWEGDYASGEGSSGEGSNGEGNGSEGSSGEGSSGEGVAAEGRPRRGLAGR